MSTVRPMPATYCAASAPPRRGSRRCGTAAPALDTRAVAARRPWRGCARSSSRCRCAASGCRRARRRSPATTLPLKRTDTLWRPRSTFLVSVLTWTAAPTTTIGLDDLGPGSASARGTASSPAPRATGNEKLPSASVTCGLPTARSPAVNGNALPSSTTWRPALFVPVSWPGERRRRRRARPSAASPRA